MDLAIDLAMDLIIETTEATLAEMLPGVKVSRQHSAVTARTREWSLHDGASFWVFAQSGPDAIKAEVSDVSVGYALTTDFYQDGMTVSDVLTAATSAAVIDAITKARATVRALSFLVAE